MPFALIFVAVALIVAGFRGTQGCLYSLIKQDVSGQFLQWGAAIFVVGGLGYVKTLAPVSTALLVLLIVVLFLGHGGVFTQAANALQSAGSSGTAATPATVQPTSSNTAPTFGNLTTGLQLLQSTGIGSGTGY